MQRSLLGVCVCMLNVGAVFVFLAALFIENNEQAIPSRIRKSKDNCRRKCKIDIATYLPNENDFPDSNRTNRNCSTTCLFHLKTFHRSIVNKTDNREHNSRSSGIEKKTEQESISINVWLSCGRTGEYTWCAMHSGRP